MTSPGDMQRIGRARALQDGLEVAGAADRLAWPAAMLIVLGLSVLLWFVVAAPAAWLLG